MKQIEIKANKNLIEKCLHKQLRFLISGSNPKLKTQYDWGVVHVETDYMVCSDSHVIHGIKSQLKTIEVGDYRVIQNTAKIIILDLIEVEENKKLFPTNWRDIVPTLSRNQHPTYKKHKLPDNSYYSFGSVASICGEKASIVLSNLQEKIEYVPEGFYTWNSYLIGRMFKYTTCTHFLCGKSNQPIELQNEELGCFCVIQGMRF